MRSLYYIYIYSDSIFEYVENLVGVTYITVNLQIHFEVNPLAITDSPNGSHYLGIFIIEY